MGVWRGAAPISDGGDWTHGAKLALKFNNHKFGGKPQVSDEDVAAIGTAYGLAYAWLAEAYRVVLDLRFGKKGTRLMPTDEGVVDIYFGDGSVNSGAAIDHQSILGVLGLTLSGFEEMEKLYLFDSATATKKGHVTSEGGPPGGYVRQYGVGNPDKQDRPLALSTRKGTGPGTVDFGAVRKGHIHFNVEVLKQKDGTTQAAITLLHEATHRYAGTGDFGYVSGSDKYVFNNVEKTLTQAEKLNNADTYAHFCYHMTKRHSFYG